MAIPRVQETNYFSYQQLSTVGLIAPISLSELVSGEHLAVLLVPASHSDDVCMYLTANDRFSRLLTMTVAGRHQAGAVAVAKSDGQKLFEKTKKVQSGL